MIESLIDRLPGSGMDAHTAVSRDAIGVRAGDCACIAHPRWMNRDQLAEVVATAQRLLSRWPA